MLIAVVLVIVIEFTVKRTAFGRRFEASGANAAAGRAAGLRGNRYQISAYLGAALLYCTAGVLLAGIVSQPDPFQGNNYLLPSVAAVALGGTSLLGGVGSVVASAVGCPVPQPAAAVRAGHRGQRRGAEPRPGGRPGPRRHRLRGTSRAAAGPRARPDGRVRRPRPDPATAPPIPGTRRP